MPSPNDQPSDAKKLAKSAGRMLKNVAKKQVKRAISHLLKATAPYWGPPVFIIVMACTAYVILFSIPQQAMADGSSALTQVEAFLGLTGSNNDGSAINAHLLEDYKKISNTWNDGLTEEQKRQVVAYKFPWSALAAVDRVVNDEATWDGKQNVVPHPQVVFDILRPKFTWKDSVITTVTVTCSIVTTTSADGQSSSSTVCSTSTNTNHVSLISAVDSFEGHYSYVYKEQTDVTSSPNGGSTTITREVVTQVKQPTVYYLPLRQYLLTSRGIKDEATFELVKELALVYSPEYQFNRALGGQSSVNKPTYALAYASGVQQIMAQHPGVPQPLFMALIAHESGGNWKATNSANTNGTTDAGLCQINSVNWAGYGLEADPYNVSRNVQAGITILGQALSQYGDFTQALYAYNGGTPSNGQKYNPTYAPDVMGIYAKLQSAPAYAELISPMPNQPITIIAAEQSGAAWTAYGQSGVDFANPAQITVVNERTNESKKAERTPGDGTAWAQEAWLYHPALTDIKDGDVLTVNFDDGKTVQVTAQMGGKIGQMIQYAATFLGSPYVFGGDSPITGFDCSSYVQYVFAKFGVQLPRVTGDQIQMGQAVEQAVLQPGDLVFFTTYESGASHVGIYLGNRMMIDDQNNGVSYDNLDSPYWSSRYYGARRVAFP